MSIHETILRNLIIEELRLLNEEEYENVEDQEEKGEEGIATQARAAAKTAAANFATSKLQGATPAGTAISKMSAAIKANQSTGKNAADSKRMAGYTRVSKSIPGVKSTLEKVNQLISSLSKAPVESVPDTIENAQEELKNTAEIIKKIEKDLASS